MLIFKAKVKESPFLQDKSVADIMSTYKDNIRSFLSNGIPNSSPSWQAGKISFEYEINIKFQPCIQFFILFPFQYC